jgi:hypothetical protein
VAENPKGFEAGGTAVGASPAGLNSDAGTQGRDELR